MAKRPLLDLLPRNSEFHNFSSLQLTDRQARVIGLGLKFRPTLKPPTPAEFDLQIQDFCRSVRLHYKFEGESQDPNFNPKLYVRSGWNPPREDPDLEDNLYALRKELKRNICSKHHWKNNLSSVEREELNAIKADETVRVLGTDKNLGPALVSTDWVKTETLRQLSDIKSYSIVTIEEWTLRHQQVISLRDKLMKTYQQFITSNASKFLRSFDHFCNPAKFYIIPKIHKNPMVGRPIVASHSYITRPISVFVDEFLKPNIKMPTVLRDSGELVQILESTQLPNSHCFLVTADVISLYPNVDFRVALVGLDSLLREAHAPETPLLIQLARLVFENNFIQTEFSQDIFHQIFGIAMGTPFAVTVANAFMFYLEKDLVTQYSDYLVIYKRFIDDIFLIWSGEKDKLLEFLSCLNNRNDRINLTYVIEESSIAFLDLLLFKEPSANRLQFSTYQKPLNKYLYIPFESFHPASNKRAFIKGELIRYARNSSTFDAFCDTREKFWKRLRVRGYPIGFLLPLFRDVKYCNRSRWLGRKAKRSIGGTVIFKSAFNCSNAGIKKTIQKYLPDLNCVVCYKSTTTLAHLCK